jgi:predicted oxidoreductase
MNLNDFNASLDKPCPPKQTSVAVRALWHQAKGDWETAHRLAQSEDTKASAWVHAHLHRVEGDQPNASYWYRRAGQDIPAVSLSEELQSIISELP